MRNKAAFNEILNIISNSNKCLIFPHIVADGDTIGSSVALCAALRDMGKEAYVLMEDEIPNNLKFLAKDYITKDMEIISDLDLCIAIDSSDKGRLGNRLELFSNCKTTVNIDHHPTNTKFAMHNYVDDESAATGEIIFDILKAMKCDFNTDIAEGLYVSISSDTGNFVNSNTTKKSHLYVAELFDYDIDTYKINVELFQNFRKEKYYLLAELWSSLDFYFDEKVVIGHLTQKTLHEMGAKLEETDGAIDYLKSIYGVEIAVFIKEIEDTTVKVSMRSKEYADVSKIAFKFGGGGHKKAAGFTINNEIMEAKKIIVEEIDRLLNEND